MKKVCCLLLAFFILFPLASCKKNHDTAVRVFVLNGTTGFGIAPLISTHQKGEARLNYTFTVEKDATHVRDAIINGSADIAAVPTNVAATLYNATSGGVKVLALNTAGVLYVVTTGGTVNSLSDLVGKTLFTPAQNPAFITGALLREADISGVTLDSATYADPTALRDAVASGLVEYAVLPEPMVTIAKAAADAVTVTVALDLTTEWDKHFTPGSLVQGCVVVRTAFLEEHPDAVATFLEEYEASVNTVKNDSANAARLIAEAGILNNANVAAAALPNCHIIYKTGEEMKTALDAFLAKMPPASIGGALPDDDFYYSKE